MPKYTVLLFAGKPDPIHRAQIECRRADVPDTLACVVMDYLNGASYPGTMRAHVISGRRRAEYMIPLENNVMHVYRHVAQVTRLERR